MADDTSGPPSQTTPDVPPTQIALGLAAFVSWCIIFNLGNSVGAAPLFTALNGHSLGTFHWIVDFVAINFVFTPTNVLMLSLCAGFVGTTLGRLEPPAEDSEERAAKPGRRWLKALLGSFMVYLVVLSGVLAILGLPFKLPEITNTADVEKAQISYRITATSCSLFSLIEGARPFVLAAVAGRIQWFFTPRPSSPIPEVKKIDGER